ncbi:transporter [Salmonella enterica]|nr:transporter [Salmonella enterica]EBJ3272203.1 transporter [Salmonella enterica]ECE0647697.1 transporter [Salmonella enterica subsp. houtenae]EDO5296494.1 transporter [Salmonella enterica subsp. houtenae serovar 40:z4,z24:-]
MQTERIVQKKLVLYQVGNFKETRRYGRLSKPTKKGIS